MRRARVQRCLLVLGVLRVRVKLFKIQHGFVLAKLLVELGDLAPSSSSRSKVVDLRPAPRWLSQPRVDSSILTVSSALRLHELKRSRRSCATC
eukprot:6205776-Amphidinium_carterae.2